MLAAARRCPKTKRVRTRRKPISRKKAKTSQSHSKKPLQTPALHSPLQQQKTQPPHYLTNNRKHSCQLPQSSPSKSFTPIPPQESHRKELIDFRLQILDGDDSAAPAAAAASEESVGALERDGP
ncbi:hypothetical protein Fot_14011 [Forsythia ovata]|uniref:Uncharacterized protein n=1 Tax=Forsythia ovata TaxID=205694 RepID=A0ABD1W7E3_9LAMI